MCQLNLGLGLCLCDGCEYIRDVAPHYMPDIEQLNIRRKLPEVPDVWQQTLRERLDTVDELTHWHAPKLVNCIISTLEVTQTSLLQTVNNCLFVPPIRK